MRKTLSAALVSMLAAGLVACSAGAGGAAESGTSGELPSGSGSEAIASQPTQPSKTAAGNGDEPEDTSPKTIVFGTFWPDDRFQEAKKKYEALHPNVTIELQNVETDNEHLEAALEKYVTTTNARMLAGKGPDMLEMDLLPIDDYAKHGLLADMGAMMDQDPSFRKEDYFGNILDNSRIGSKLYAMPLSFFLLGLSADEAAIAETGVKVDDKTWSWSDFAETAKKLAAKDDQSAAFVGTPEYLLAEMVSDDYSLFVDSESRKAKFDSASFIGIMQQVKAMFDDGVATSSGRRAIFNRMQVNSPWDYLVSLRESSENSAFYVKPHAKDSDGGGYFRSYRTIGINANSKVQKEAWKFVEFMMSGQIETPPESAGIPINKSAFEGQIAKLKKQGTVKAYEEGPLQGLTFKVDGKKLDLLEDYVNGATHSASYQSDKIQEIVRTESLAYFGGQKSADNVAKLIQNKATTYLNE